MGFDSALRAASRGGPLRARLEAIVPPAAAVEARECARDRPAEFAAGRACARAALERLGVGACEPGILEDGAPSWPEGIIGSISHSQGLAAAVAARRGEIEGLGLDVARIRSVDSDIAGMFATASERSWLSSLPAATRPFWALVLFGAKESFQKCARPVLGRLPAPRSIGIRILAESSTLAAVVEDAHAWTWRGRFAVDGGYLLAATVARPSAQRTRSIGLGFVPRITPVL